MKTEMKLACSFCGKQDTDVDFFICGPAVNICSGCVELCNEIIADKKQEKMIENLTENIGESVFKEYWEGA